jgi:hypothetical protein
MRRIGGEAFPAAGAAEPEGRAGVIVPSGRRGRLDRHPADRIRGRHAGILPPRGAPRGAP